MTGKIIKQISNDYTILCENERYICKARGKFRNDKLTPLVGDLVDFDKDKLYILDILKRKNELVRPSVSNIDISIIVASVKHPHFSSYLLDKLITIIEFNNIEPVICFTKLDLLNKEEILEINNYIDYYKKIGYQVFKNTEIEEIKTILANKNIVITGQSGSGKSTLLNKIDPTLNLKTDDISYALGRGKHTTRHVEMIDLCNGLVADTPGFSNIDFNGMSSQDIRDSFIDFNLYRDMCKYKDCLHNKEDKCYIKERVLDGSIMESRYDNYIKFIGEVHEKNNSFNNNFTNRM